MGNKYHIIENGQDKANKKTLSNFDLLHLHTQSYNLSLLPKVNIVIYDSESQKIIFG